MGSQRRKRKMYNILKTADRRAKRMKIWDSRSSPLYFRCGVIFMSESYEFIFVSFGALCKILDVIWADCQKSIRL